MPDDISVIPCCWYRRIRASKHSVDCGTVEYMNLVASSSQFPGEILHENGVPTEMLWREVRRYHQESECLHWPIISGAMIEGRYLFHFCIPDNSVHCVVLPALHPFDNTAFRVSTRRIILQTQRCGVRIPRANGPMSSIAPWCVQFSICRPTMDIWGFPISSR